MVFALVVPLLTNARTLVGGAVTFGIALYLFNFEVLGRLFFESFQKSPKQLFELFIHAVYGLLLVPFFASALRVGAAPSAAALASTSADRPVTRRGPSLSTRLAEPHGESAGHRDVADREMAQHPAGSLATVGVHRRHSVPGSAVAWSGTPTGAASPGSACAPWSTSPHALPRLPRPPAQVRAVQRG